MTRFLLKIFIKNHENTSDLKVRENYGKFSGIVGIISNLLLFLIKFITGLVFNSISIMADAVNNLSDFASSLITVVGFKLSGKPADEEHPYGHARIEYISGLIISFLVLILGLQLAKSSIEKIIYPETADFGIEMCIRDRGICKWRYRLLYTGCICSVKCDGYLCVYGCICFCSTWL